VLQAPGELEAAKRGVWSESGDQSALGRAGPNQRGMARDLAVALWRIARLGRRDPMQIALVQTAEKCSAPRVLPLCLA
jgi:hypothetical protein